MDYNAAKLFSTCVSHWSIADGDEEGWLEIMRGKQATGRRNTCERSVEDKLRRAETRIKLLDKENELIDHSNGIIDFGEPRDCAPKASASVQNL